VLVFGETAIFFSSLAASSIVQNQILRRPVLIRFGGVRIPASDLPCSADALPAPARCPRMDGTGWTWTRLIPRMTT
jgi:hypothetical protein